MQKICDGQWTPLVHPTILQSIAFRLWQIYLPKIVKVDNYRLHLLAVQFICNGQWWLAEWSDVMTQVNQNVKKGPLCHEKMKNSFSLWITFNFWWSAKWSKQQKSTEMQKTDPLSHQKMKCLVLDYIQLLMIGWAIWVAWHWPKCKIKRKKAPHVIKK